ncbi:hypothetical protein L1049_023462 [Liquidambar formosana]|uniref:Chorein N-terminal domain-containing protein n=1 Tax=Liquidambar formosana TaxID=63359 RepID=A0AAP0RTI6_LIQFO
MFEGLVRHLLLGYLGRYVKDIPKEQLKITLWNENIIAKDYTGIFVGNSLLEVNESKLGNMNSSNLGSVYLRCCKLAIFMSTGEN